MLLEKLIEEMLTGNFILNKRQLKKVTDKDTKETHKASIIKTYEIKT